MFTRFNVIYNQQKTFLEGWSAIQPLVKPPIPHDGSNSFPPDQLVNK